MLVTDIKKIDDKEEAAEGYCGLGMTYYEQKQYDQALEMLEKAFDNGTVKTAELCNLAGTSALCKEDYAKALEYIQEGIALAEEKQGNKKQEDKKLESFSCGTFKKVEGSMGK